MENAHILIVDDESNILRFMGAGLRAEGYRVTESTNGLEALQSVEEASPDLVILDILMPSMDGFELCRRIRESSTVPIIMLSAMAEEQDKVRCLILGAFSIVPSLSVGNTYQERLKQMVQEQAQQIRAQFGEIVQALAREQIALQEMEAMHQATGGGDPTCFL